MAEVLEVEQIEAENQEQEDSKIASWLIEIPVNAVKELGLAEGSRIALTVKDGEVSGDILPPMSDEMQKVSKRVLEKRREVYEELKRLGD